MTRKPSDPQQEQKKEENKEKLREAILSGRQLGRLKTKSKVRKFGTSIKTAGSA
jgi:hypothetical protein